MNDMMLALSILLSTAPSAEYGRSDCDDGRPITAMTGSRIAAEGDSLTYGQDESGTGVASQINGAAQKRSPAPFPETLGRLLGGKAQVENRGFPGDRMMDGLARWRGVPRGDLTIVMYGGNDALNNGGLPGGIVPLSRFRDDLMAEVARNRASGGRTVLLLTPDLQDRSVDERVEPYRAMVCSVARYLHLPVIDTRPLTRGVSDRWVDGVHLSAAANRTLASGLAKRFRFVPR